MSPIREYQVKDSDFLSPWEHDNESQHYFYKLADVPTYSGTSHGGKFIRVKDDLSGLEYTAVSGISDHGELSGLLDDDHSQYFNTIRGDIRYYTQDQISVISGSLQDNIDNVNEIINQGFQFTDLTDTPTTFSGAEGKYLRVTASGIEFEDLDLTTFSGTEVFVAGDATVTGTMYAHIYDSYSPLIIKDGGVVVISGTGHGDIIFPTGATNSFTYGEAVPTYQIGKVGDIYLNTSNKLLYKKVNNKSVSDSEDKFTGGTAYSSTGTASKIFDDDVSSTSYISTASDFWVKYDFGEGVSHALNKLRIYPGENGGYTALKDWTFSGSNDDLNWDLLSSGRLDPLVYLTWVDVVFENFVPYRYYKFTNVGNYYGTWRYLYELEGIVVTDNSWLQIEDLNGISNHDELLNLDYDSSGHTGFAPTVHEHTFLDLIDTPTTYSGSSGKYLYTTSSGIEFIDLDSQITTISGALQNQIDSLSRSYYYVESNSESDVNNSPTYLTKAYLTVGSGITGTFRVGYTMDVKSVNDRLDVYDRFYNDTDSVVLSEICPSFFIDNSFTGFSGFAVVSFTGFEKTFKLEYAAGQGGCSVRNAMIEAWRVE